MKAYLFALVTGCILMYSCKETPKTEENKMVEAEVEEKTAVAAPEIIPIEHATAVLVWGDNTIYIDPVGGAGAFEGQPAPDLILITDVHGDHLNVETLTALSSADPTLIAPKAVAEQLPEELKGNTIILENGQTEAFNGIGVHAIPMYNLREEAKEFHVKGRGNGYVLDDGETRVYFSGDTEDIPEMRALEDIDMAFVCMNLPYTMTVESAADAVLEFAPDQVYPYHFRGRPDVSDVSEFKRIVNEGNPDIEVVQLDWYPGEDY